MDLPEKMPAGFFLPMNKETQSCTTLSGHTIVLEGFKIHWKHSRNLGEWSVMDSKCFEHAYSALRSAGAMSDLFGSFGKLFG